MVAPELSQLGEESPRCSFTIPLKNGTLPRVEGDEHKKAIIREAAVAGILMELHNKVYTDSLTGIANRLSFAEELEARVEAAKEDDDFALLFIDLDKFKQVNDTRGHDTGDKLLCAVADRLQIHVREGEFVARLGGDEFVAIINPHNSGDGKRSNNHNPQEVVEGLKHRLVSEINLAAQEAGTPFVGASIGVAFFREGESATDVLERADQAMYEDKNERGGGR